MNYYNDDVYDILHISTWFCLCIRKSFKIVLIGNQFCWFIFTILIRRYFWNMIDAVQAVRYDTKRKRISSLKKWSYKWVISWFCAHFSLTECSSKHMCQSIYKTYVFAIFFRRSCLNMHIRGDKSMFSFYLYADISVFEEWSLVSLSIFT